MARQLLKNLKSYKPKTAEIPPEGADNVEKGDEGHLVSGLSPASKMRSLSHHKYYKCKLCKDRFHKQSHLKCHTRLSHYKLSFVCIKCHNHFQSKQRLRHHRCPVDQPADTHPEEVIDQMVPMERLEQMDEVEEREVVMESGVHQEEVGLDNREQQSPAPMHTYHPQGPPLHEPLPHHGVPVGVEHMKYNDDEEDDPRQHRHEVEERSPQDSHGNIRHPEEDRMQMSPKAKASPCQSNTSGGSSRSAHSSNEDQESPKVRERTSSCTPGTSPEDDNENAMRDYRNGPMPAGPGPVTPNLMRTPNLTYMPEVNYYMKDSPPDPNRERTFFQDRRHLPLPPIPLHRFDTAFGNPLPSIIPRPGQPPDVRGQYENGNLSNLPSPIPTTQPLQSFLGKKDLPLLNIQKNNAFISQLIAASCIPTPSSTSTSNIFTSQTTPTSGNTFETTESGGNSTTPPQQDYPPPPPPPPPQVKPVSQQQQQQQQPPQHSQTPSSESASGADNSNLNQFLDYKKYSCKICHRKFSQRSSLNRHVYTIHWNMKIKCAFCTKTYTQKCLLKQHVYEEHGVEACLQMFSANERINWKMQLVNSQKQRLNLATDEDDSAAAAAGKSMKQEASST